ncbi:hypothetical protein J8J27_33975, partial [Mycobacterium tuberculosis]|nr:hypothetical protein [Mycobacterium tuberculosis]
LKSDANLAGIDVDSFRFDDRPAALALAFVSPHVDFQRVTAALARLAGPTKVLAVTTAGELCGVDGAELYCPTGERWSNV